MPLFWIVWVWFSGRCKSDILHTLTCRGYGVHTSLINLPHNVLIPPNPLEKGTKIKVPLQKGDLGGSDDLCVQGR